MTELRSTFKWAWISNVSFEIWYNFNLQLDNHLLRQQPPQLGQTKAQQMAAGTSKHTWSSATIFHINSFLNVFVSEWIYQQSPSAMAWRAQYINCICISIGACVRSSWSITHSPCSVSAEMRELWCTHTIIQKTHTRTSDLKKYIIWPCSCFWQQAFAS